MKAVLVSDEPQHGHTGPADPILGEGGPGAGGAGALGGKGPEGSSAGPLDAARLGATAREDRYTRVCARSRATLVRLVRPVVDEDAEDVTQDTLLALRDDPILDRPDGEIAAWLRRVALNLSFNHLRDRRRWRARAARGGELEATLATPVDPADEACRQDERRRVREALADLPARQRDCLLLRYSGYAYAEIATTLGMPAGSVGTTLARAERAFRDLLHRTDVTADASTDPITDFSTDPASTEGELR